MGATPVESRITNQKIAIVGGGPGGLTLARLLQQQGAAVTVYERDRSRQVRVQGATLDLHEESGLAALRAAGLLDAFRAAYRPGAGRLRVVDEHATVWLDEHAADASVEDDRPEIDRGPLRELLLDALAPGTVVWDRQFAALTPHADGGWEIAFQNGATAHADLVIAADGANSRIRPLLTPRRPFYAGLTVVEGTVQDAAATSPRISALLHGGKIFAFGHSQSIIVSSKGDGSYVFYTGCKTPEHWASASGIDFSSREQVRQWFGEEFAGWDAGWHELVEHAELPLTPRPQFCAPLDQTWAAQPNLTMLGDAAHVMPPYAGEGVNMAMLDALELSASLLDPAFATTQEAIAHYETAMRARAAATAQQTLDSMAMLHAPGAAANLIHMFAGVEEGGE